MEAVAHGFVRLVVHLQEHDIWVLLGKLGNLQGIIIKEHTEKCNILYGVVGIRAGSVVQL